MSVQLTARQSRLLALLLLLMALSLAVAAVVLPAWRLHQHYDKHIEDYSDHLARYRRIAALRPDIDVALNAVQSRDTRKTYLKATTATLAAAELQGLATRIVETHNGRIISSQVLPQKDDGKSSPGKISLSLQASAAIVPLQLILHALETNEPYLFVDQLSVRANQGRAYKPVPGVQPEFVVQLTISAHMADAGGGKP